MRLQWVPEHSFFLGNYVADEVAGQFALLAPSAIPCSLSSPLFSQIGGVLSHLQSSTHRSPQYPLKNLRSLVTPTVLSLVFAATDTAFVSSHLSRIENSSCNTCGHPTHNTTHFILHCRTLCAARSFAILSLNDLWSRSWGVARLLRVHGLPPCNNMGNSSVKGR